MITYIEHIWAAYNTPLIFIFTVTIIVLTPILRYVSNGWKYKKDDIINSIDDDAKSIYLEKFLKIREGDTKRFIENYHSRYGRRHFIIPLFVIALVVILEAALSIESLVNPEIRFWSAKLDLNAAALAAVAGAFMWVVSDFIGRARRTDFSPADVLWGSLRLFIAAPLGLSVGSILKPDALAFVAFGLGAFPLETVQSLLRRLTLRSMNISADAEKPSQILGLDGVDQVLVDRLASEDITSIVQLAYCDPIQLTMRSNLSFNTVVDLVSQALAWVYVGEKLKLIRPLGLRGAYEIRQFCEDLAVTKPYLDQVNAKNLIPAIAECLGVSEERMWYMITTISYDPYNDFIYKTWS